MSWTILNVLDYSFRDSNCPGLSSGESKYIALFILEALNVLA